MPIAIESGFNQPLDALCNQSAASDSPSVERTRQPSVSDGVHGRCKRITFVSPMRVLRMEKRPSKKTTPPLTCDGQWTMDTRGRVVVPPPCVTPPNLPHPKTQTRKESMEQSVHRLLSQSVCGAARRVNSVIGERVGLDLLRRPRRPVVTDGYIDPSIQSDSRCGFPTPCS